MATHFITNLRRFLFSMIVIVIHVHCTSKLIGYDPRGVYVQYMWWVSVKPGLMD